MTTDAVKLTPTVSSTDATGAAETPPTSIVTASYAGPERRKAARRAPRRFFGWHLLSRSGGRRSPGRRAEDWQRPYVDWYETPLMIAAVAVMLLAALEAFVTLQLWQLGAPAAASPLADALDSDVSGYVGSKLALTALALVLMVIFKNFSVCGRLRVSHMLYALLGVYALLVVGQVHVWLSLREFRVWSGV